MTEDILGLASVQMSSVQSLYSSFKTKAIFRVARYWTILSVSTLAVMAITSTPVMFSSDLAALITPDWAASSQLMGDSPIISMTLMVALYITSH